MDVSDAEDHNGAPHGSPGLNLPAVDAALFLSVWRAHGVRTTVVLSANVVLVCNLLWCRFILPLVVLRRHTT